MTHQARVLDATGSPIEGTQPLTVALYTAQDNGSEVWTRMWPSVQLSDGYFSVMLQDGTPSLDTTLLESGDEIWLEMSVGGVTITPRTPLGQVVSQNVRAIVTKSAADAHCPGKAVHVPWSYRGQTGAQICAADARYLNTCTGVKYVYVTNGNSYGTYAPNDRSFSQTVDHPWPWGQAYSAPNTLSSEWVHGSTWVVCCQ